MAATEEDREELTLYLRAYIPSASPSVDGFELPEDVAPWLPSVDPDSLLAASLLAAAFPKREAQAAPTEAEGQTHAQRHPLVTWRLASSASLPREERSAAPLLVSSHRLTAVSGIGPIYDLLAPLLPPTSTPARDTALRAYLQRSLAPLTQHALYAIPTTFNERTLTAYQLAYRATSTSTPAGVRGWLARRARQAAATNEVIRLRAQLSPALALASLPTPDEETTSARQAAAATAVRTTALPAAGSDVYASSTTERALAARHPSGMDATDTSTTARRFRQAKIEERACDVLATASAMYSAAAPAKTAPCTATDVLAYALLAPLLSEPVVRGTDPPQDEEEEPLSYIDNIVRRPAAAPLLGRVRAVHAHLWPGQLGDRGAQWRAQHEAAPQCIADGTGSPRAAHQLGPASTSASALTSGAPDGTLSPPASAPQLAHLVLRGVVEQARGALWFVPGVGVGRPRTPARRRSGPSAVSDEERAIARRRKFWVAGTALGLVWWLFASGIVQIVVESGEEDELEDGDVNEKELVVVDGDANNRTSSGDEEHLPTGADGDVRELDVDEEGYLHDPESPPLDDGWQAAEDDGFDPDEIDPDDIDAQFDYDDEE